MAASARCSLGRPRASQAVHQAARFSVLVSPDAPGILNANKATIGKMWPQVAFAAGLDARDMTAHNLNKGAAWLYNQRAIPLGMSPIAAPAHWQQQNVGFGGTQQVEEDTGERKPGLAREMPVKVGERQDPNTGQMVAVYQNWAGGPQPGSASGARRTRGWRHPRGSRVQSPD